MARVPRLALTVFAVLPAFFLFTVNGRNQGSQDNLATVESTVSLIREGNLELSEFSPPGEPLPYYRTHAKAPGVYSAYPYGMIVFALPLFSVSLALGAPYGYPESSRIDKLTSALVASFSLGLFLLLGLALSSRRSAMTVTIWLMTGSVFLSTLGQGLWSHGGVVFGLLLALVIEVLKEGRPRGVWLLGQGAAVAIMVACRSNAALIILLLFLWKFFRDPKGAFFTAIYAALSFMPFGLTYTYVHGSFFGPQMAWTGVSEWWINPLPGILALLFSPGRGLFVYQPWLLLLFLFLVPKVRKAVSFSARGVSGLGLIAGISALAQLFLVGSWFFWPGGTSYGSRLLSEVIPLLGLLVLFPMEWLFSTTKGSRWALGLGVAAFLIHANAAFGRAGLWSPEDMGVPYSAYWSWRKPPFLHPFHW